MSPLTSDEQKRVQAIFAESWAKAAERDKQRRIETGDLEIVMESAPTDPPVQDPPFQAELNIFGSALHQAGIPYSQSAIAFDSLDAHGYPLAEFAIQLLNSSAVGVVGTAIGVWLKGRYGRKVRLKFGEVEVEARTPEEVEQLLKRAAAFCASVRTAGKEE